MFKHLTIKIHEDPNQLINVSDAFKVSREHSQQKMQTDPGQSQSVPNEIRELETYQQLLEELGALNNPTGF